MPCRDERIQRSRSPAVRRREGSDMQPEGYSKMDRGHWTMKYASGLSLNFNPDCWLEVDPVVTQHMREWKYPPREARGWRRGWRERCEEIVRKKKKETGCNEAGWRCRRTILAIWLHAWVSDRHLITRAAGRKPARSSKKSLIFVHTRAEGCAATTWRHLTPELCRVGGYCNPHRNI